MFTFISHFSNKVVQAAYVIKTQNYRKQSMILVELTGSKNYLAFKMMSEN